MARVTVEDCIEKVPNRFDLVMLAAQRARDIASGAQLTIERGREKNPVLALREIAQATILPKDLEEALIRGHQKTLAQQEAEQEIVDLMTGEQAWADAAAAEAAERMIGAGSEATGAVLEDMNEDDNEEIGIDEAASEDKESEA